MALKGGPVGPVGGSGSGEARRPVGLDKDIFSGVSLKRGLDAVRRCSSFDGEFGGDSGFGGGGDSFVFRRRFKLGRRFPRCGVNFPA